MQSLPPILCIILARAGSKGLPGKNAIDLLGRPLIAYTIDHAKQSRRVSRIVVSTDGHAIAAAAREQGIDILARPPHLATDTATVDAAARHALHQVEALAGRTYDFVVILYANIPLRPAGLIDRAIDKLLATGCDSVQSVCPVGKTHPYWMKTLGGTGGDVLQHYQPNSIYRRQDLPPAYMLDGGIIAVTRSSLMRVDEKDAHAFLGADRRAVVTQPGEVVDVDTAEDLAVAQAMLQSSRVAPRRGTPARKIVPISRHSSETDSASRSDAATVIAELGVNHDGRLARALELTRAAKQAGADAVKLQLFDPHLLLSREAALADYQKENAADVFDMLASLQLSIDEMLHVRDLAHELGLGFIVTPFSVDLADAMRRLDVDAVKIASPDAVNPPLIEAMAALGRPMLLSTGTCSLDELAPAVALCRQVPTSLLHCVSAYPTPLERANLTRIANLSQRFGLPVGYSDHTTELHTGMLAVGQGATIIERHLTYDRAAAGPDHAASLDPTQFAQYVQLIRSAETALRVPAADDDIEAEVRRLSRQSVCLRRPVKAGQTLTRDDLTIKRPGTGIPAAQLERVIGRRMARGMEANTLLRENDLLAEGAAAA